MKQSHKRQVKKRQLREERDKTGYPANWGLSRRQRLYRIWFPTRPPVIGLR